MGEDTPNKRRKGSKRAKLSLCELNDLSKQYMRELSKLSVHREKNRLVVDAPSKTVRDLDYRFSMFRLHL